jgi:hypothetical protein
MDGKKKGFGRKWAWLSLQYYSGILIILIESPREKIFQDEFRKNTSLERYRYTNLLVSRNKKCDVLYFHVI